MWWVIAGLVSVASLAGFVAAARLMEPACCRHARHQRPLPVNRGPAARESMRAIQNSNAATYQRYNRSADSSSRLGDRGCVT